MQVLPGNFSSADDVSPLPEYDLYEFNYLNLSFSGSNAGVATDITTLRHIGDVLHVLAEKWVGTRPLA
jgi:hypothetical protein